MQVRFGQQMPWQPAQQQMNNAFHDYLRGVMQFDGRSRPINQTLDLSVQTFSELGNAFGYQMIASQQLANVVEQQGEEIKALKSRLDRTL